MCTQSEVLLDLQEFTSGRIPGKEMMRKRFSLLLEQYREKIKSFPLIIKVAGTNGKGSLCAMLSAYYNYNKKKAGMFTSPHMLRYTERFVINGSEISEETLDNAAKKVKEEIVAFVNTNGPEYIPSFFEALLLIALTVFHEEKVQVAILEAGIGGYSDAVSLIPSEFAVITSVGMDHTEELGNTIEDIARDKMGIATPGSILILGPKVDGAAIAAIHKETPSLGIMLQIASMSILKVKSYLLAGTHIFLRETNQSFTLPLAGKFQVYNFATLYELLRAITPKGRLFSTIPTPRCFKKLRWPGRMEHLAGRPNWLLDAAHNHHAFLELTQTIPQLIHPHECVLLYGTSQEKEYERYLNLLPELASEIFITDDFYRAESAKKIRKLLPPTILCKGTYSSLTTAIETIQDNLDYHNKTIIVTGSIYMMGKVREYLLKNKKHVIKP